MPGGLPSVEQKFTAESSGYSAAIAAMIKDNQALIKSIGDVQRKIAELKTAMGGLGDKRIKVEVTGVDKAISDIGRLKAALDGLGDRSVIVRVVNESGAGAGGAAAAAAASDVARQARDMRDAASGMADAAEKMRRATRDGGGASSAARDAAASAATSVISSELVRRASSDLVPSLSRLLSDAFRRAYSDAGVHHALGPGGGLERAGGGSGWTWSASVIPDMMRAVGSGGGPWGPWGHGGGGGWPSGGWTGGSFGSPGWASGGGSGPGGGGGGGGGYAAGGLWAAAGGGGRDAGGFMTAAQYADKIVPWLRRWAPIAHYAIMGVNEALATILPATAAAGAATLVGWQGVEQMIPRIQAINATAESLGGAYGISSGQYLGTGNAIQRYQDRATGGVYELGGAGINLMRMGAGTFGQTGLSTIAMLDRGVANMQINMQKRGTMGLLGGIAGQGTDYLRQFGDVGANLGNIFLGLAPHLPGVGGDYLSALEGITGGAAGGIGFLNQHHLGDLLGAGLAGEAGWRIGTPMLGLAGRGLGSLGGLAAKLGLGSTAMSEKEIASIAARAGIAPGLIDASGTGLAGALEGAGAGLGMLTGPAVAGLALSAFLGSKLVSSMPTGAMRQVSGLQAGIGQAGFSAAFQPLAHAIVTTQGLASQAPKSGLAALRQVETPYEIGRFGPGITPTYADTYATAAHGFTQTMGDLINAGPQLVSALKKAGLKSVSMADAFQIAQNALLDTTHAFDKHGHLKPEAIGMLMNYGAAIKPMTQTGGAFNAVIGAQQIMGSPAMKTLTGVNQAMDSMVQIASGGPAGMANLFGMLGGTPTTVSHGGMKLAPPPAITAMAKALTSFTSAQGAAAWRTFAGPQGLVAAEQQNLDQLRTYMTLGVLGSRGATGIAGFQLQQLLPMAKQSPAALSLLMQQAAGIGIGGYYTGDPTKRGVQAANYAAFQKSLGGSAFTEQGLTNAMNRAVVKANDIPAVAAHFMQGMNADVLSKMMAQGSQDVMGLKKSAAGGHVNMGALGDLVGVLKQQGLSVGHGLVAGIDAALKQAGVGKAMRIRIEAQVTGLDKLNALKNKQVNAKVNVAGAGELKHLQAEIAALHSKEVRAAAKAQGAAAVAALNAEIAALHSKEVTITTRMITIGGMPGVTPGIPAGVVNPNYNPGSFTHRASGGRIPGFGGGDIVPAMLEPGEAVVPKHLVPALSGVLAAHKVPGFAGGGFVGQNVAGPLSYWGAGSSMAMWNPAFYAQLLAAMHASQGQAAFAMPAGMRSLMAGGSTRTAGAGHGTAIIFGPEDAKAAQKAGSQLTVHVIEGMHGGLKDATSEARKLARSLVAKIQQEVQYAQGVAQSAQYGQGYDPSGHGSGIFGNMQTGNPSGLSQAQMHASPTGNIKDYNAYVAAYAADTVGGANQPKSVQDQMKDYLGTVKSFGTDIGKLRKQHLNKQVLAQLVAAGPEQGDALAKSILGGKGGVSAVNKLWSAIGSASKKLGAQAAMGQFGGTLAPNLKSGTFINNNVSINVSLSGHGGGDLQLSNSQINQLISIIQKKLLQQAKRNNKTGVKLPGKGS